VQAFYDDYEAMYAKFALWLMGVFAPRCLPGGDLSVSLYEKATEFLAAHEEFLEHEVAFEGTDKNFASLFRNRKDNAIFQKFVQKALEKGEFVMFDLIREMGKDGDFELMQRKTEAGDRDARRIVFSTPFNEWRLMLKAYYGFQDASPALGHLRRK